MSDVFSLITIKNRLFLLFMTLLMCMNVMMNSFCLLLRTQQSPLAERSLVSRSLLIIHSASDRFGATRSPRSMTCVLTSNCCCVSDPAAEEDGPSQAGSSAPAVELPRKRKGDVEERSDTRVH